MRFSSFNALGTACGTCPVAWGFVTCLTHSHTSRCIAYRYHLPFSPLAHFDSPFHLHCCVALLRCCLIQGALVIPRRQAISPSSSRRYRRMRIFTPRTTVPHTAPPHAVRSRFLPFHVASTLRSHFITVCAHFIFVHFTRAFLPQVMRAFTQVSARLRSNFPPFCSDHFHGASFQNAASMHGARHHFAIILTASLCRAHIYLAFCAFHCGTYRHRCGGVSIPQRRASLRAYSRSLNRHFLLPSCLTLLFILSCGVRRGRTLTHRVFYDD